MKLIDTSTIHPDVSTVRGKMLRWFINNVNFCSDYYDGTEKPSNPVYDFFWKYWLFPFAQTGCVCCNTVRGVLYGFIAGVAIGWLL